MTTSVKLDEVTLLYKVVDGLHYFIGNDEWSRGVVAAGPDYDTTRDQAMENLRKHLNDIHGIRQGDWEIIPE